jgi:glycerol-3-phosphate acyltransferase PlsY
MFWMCSRSLSFLAVKYVLTEHPYFLITATTGVMGHIWPLDYGFKGGRGISAIFGGVFVIEWFRTHDLYYVLYAVAINIVFNIAMIPEIKKWIRITREGKWSETANVMQLTGMGRGILKMAKRLKIYRQK